MSTNDRPDEIVQPLLRLGGALQEHAWAHRDDSLADHGEGVLAALRTAAPVLLEAVLQLATSGLETNALSIVPQCPSCRWRRGVQSRRTGQLHTWLGPVRLQRWWHHRWACGHGWSSPDLALGLAPYQQTSDGLARWEAALGAVTTFREAAKLLADLAGVHVGSETLRTQAERVGTELEGQQRRTMA